MKITDRFLIVLFLLAMSVTKGHSQVEPKEISGIIREIQPGRYFAYSLMTVESNNELIDLQFLPEHGRIIMDEFGPGDSVLLKVTLPNRTVDAATSKRMKESMLFFHIGRIVSIKIKDKWIDIASGNAQPPVPATWESKVHLNLPVVDTYEQGSQTRALVFANGLIGFYPGSLNLRNPLADVRIGERVSFIGRRFPVSEGDVYPVAGVQTVYFFQRLHRASGTIQSLLFKQNFVCIGISLSTDRGKLSASFPTEFARDVEKFADGRRIDIYVTDYKIEGEPHLPELQAIVSGRDSLLINTIGFYGGADGKHDHVPLTFQGKVTGVTKADSGKIIGVTIDDQYFVEIDGNTARQLGDALRRGKILEISGAERVKKDGEIYSKDYRIVVPYQITVDGKVFLITTRP
jgi:hypothetical protein